MEIALRVGIGLFGVATVLWGVWIIPFGRWYVKAPVGIVVGWQLFRALIYGVQPLHYWLLAGLALAWLARAAPSIAQAWYELTPHPAQRIVSRAIETGERIDVEGLKRSLRVRAENSIEQAVRDAQLARAIQELEAHQVRLSQHAEALIAQERRAAEQAAEEEREYRFGLAEEALLGAALRHEIAAAKVEGARKRTIDRV